MKGRDSGRDNLVLSMTLAEIFLLLLFVVWWSSKLPAFAGSVPAGEMQAKIEELTKKVEALTTERALLAKENGVMRALLKIGPDVSLAKLPGAVQDALDAARRGHPKCADPNVLVDVHLEDGVARMTFLQASSELLPMLSPSVRQQVSSREPLAEAGIAEVLGAMSRVYRDRRARGRDCRFDYRLGYVTDSDYVAGRERFEKVFYAGGGIERTARRRP